MRYTPFFEHQLLNMQFVGDSWDLLVFKSRTSRYVLKVAETGRYRYAESSFFIFPIFSSFLRQLPLDTLWHSLDTQSIPQNSMLFWFVLSINANHTLTNPRYISHPRHILSSATPQSSCPSPFGHAQGLSFWRTVTAALRLVAVTDWSWVAS